MSERIAVVIPNYNGMKYLAGCLDSLLHQTVYADSIIVVDNHSTDGSAEWLTEHYPQITVIRMETNTGFSAAVNRGIHEAKAEFTILLNNDIVCDSRMIEQLIRAISIDHQIFSVQAKMLNMNKPTVIDDAGDYYCALGWAFAPGKGKEKTKFSEPTRVFSCCAGAAVYRTKVFDEIGYFDEQHFAYLEDVDIGYRARLYGYQNFFEPSAIVLHAGSASSGSKYNRFKCKLAAANNIWLLYKNMPWWQILLNLPFLIPGLLIKQFFYIFKGMGLTYLKGTCSGIARCFHRGAGRYKVRMRDKRAGNVWKIQLSLWVNIVRFFS